MNGYWRNSPGRQQCVSRSVQTLVQVNFLTELTKISKLFRDDFEVSVVVLVVDECSCRIHRKHFAHDYSDVGGYVCCAPSIAA